MTFSFNIPHIQIPKIFIVLILPLIFIVLIFSLILLARDILTIWTWVKLQKFFLDFFLLLLA